MPHAVTTEKIGLYSCLLDALQKAQGSRQWPSASRIHGVKPLVPPYHAAGAEPDVGRHVDDATGT